MGLQHESLSGEIISAAIEVHRQLVPGFLESIYEQALVLELTQCAIAVQSQVEIAATYGGIPAGLHRLDLLVDAHFIVELKAVHRLEDIHYCTVRSYLKAMKQEQGLLLNFARPTVEVKRVFRNVPS